MSLERRAWWIGRILAALLVLVSLRAAYWQLWRGRALDPVALDAVAAQRTYAQLSGAPTPVAGSGQVAALVQLPQPVIQRTIELLTSIKRGTVTDRNGNILAQDTGEAGHYTRVYADPSLAQTLGYTSALRTGVTGLEATYNQALLGLDRPDTEIARMLHRPITGSNLTLTIDEQIQQAAYQALGDRPGAVVVIDAKTGAVLAMASTPTFDPNRINEKGYASSLTNSALLNRATQGLFTPGSIFKTVTLIAAVDSHEAGPNTVIDFGKPASVDANGHTVYTYMVDGGIIYDPNHKDSRLSLQDSYVYSANVAFAKLANLMSPDTFINYGERLGFSTPDYTKRFPLELPVAEPQLANDVNSLRTNNLLRANTGYGQGELLTTPLNMAMVVEAVVNNGSIPVPYFVENIKDPQGRVIQTRPSNHTVHGIMSASTAKYVRDAMAALANHWYPNLVPGSVIGGKTGTAQLGGEENPHGWFIGYATKGDRTLVAVSLLQNAGSGAAYAVPVWQQVMKVAMGK